MTRKSLLLSFWVGCLLHYGGVSSAQEYRPGENLLPKTTAGFVAIANTDQLREHWDKTQLGHLTNDPIMEPFTKDLRRQIEDRWSGVHERLGLTLDDLREVAGGEVDLALIRPAPGEAATTILLDVTGHLQEANALLVRASNNLIQQGAKKSEHVVAGTNILLFDLPKNPADPEAPPRKTVYFLTGTLLGAADNLEVVEGILARVPGDRGDSLADVPGFQAVMQRCRLDAGPATPQIRWFVHPLSYADAARAATPPDRRRKGKSILELLENQGFEALQGVGGFADFSADGFELLHRTAIHAPPPYEKSMKMLAFPSGDDFTPQPWIPREMIATYSTFYSDIVNAFDNFGPLFDEVVGEPQFLFKVPAEHQKDLEAGTLPDVFRQEFAKLRLVLSPKLAATTRTPGAAWAFSDKGESYVVRKKDGTLRVYQEISFWKEALESLEKDPHGPQIDLRKELITHLGPRVTVVSDYQLPITTTSERLLFAIATGDAKAVAAAIEKLMSNDRSAKRRRIGEHVVWEIVQEEENPDLPKIEIPKVSVGTLRDPAAEKQAEEEEEEHRLLPHAAVTVAYGHLLIASHLDFLEKVLKPTDERDTLARSPDYLRIDDTVEHLGLREKCARMFSRTDEEYRPTYELIRQNKMPEGETVLARLLNALFGQSKKGVVRRQSIDGQKLPEYDVVRRYLGPAGMAITSERDGWFIKGFLLTKE